MRHKVKSGCLPFHRSDKRSTAFLRLFFCCDGLDAFTGFSVCFLGMSSLLDFLSPFFTFSRFYLYTLKLSCKRSLFIFTVQFKVDIVCILHMFLMGPLMKLFFHNLNKKMNMRHKNQRQRRTGWRWNTFVLTFFSQRGNPAVFLSPSVNFVVDTL